MDVRRHRQWDVGNLAWLVGGLCVLGGCVAAQRAPVPPLSAPVPIEEPAAERWIRVRKTARTLSVYDGNRVLKVYPIVLGRDPVWAKLYEGDKRTPEGEYHISDKYYHPYWSRFLLLDYPTPYNREIYQWSRANGLLPVHGRQVARIGGAVGIHGTEDEGLNRRGVDWTAGCVSLFNHDVDELYDLVPIGTRVVIAR